MRAAGRQDIDAVATALPPEGKEKGIFVSFGYPPTPARRSGGFHRRTGRVITPLTAREVPNAGPDELALKLA